MLFLDSLINDNYKKWLTLFGSFLINASLGIYGTLPNLNLYIISYLREHEHLDLRYSQSPYMLTSLSFITTLFSILNGLLISKQILSTKLSILIGSLFMSLSSALTYFTVKKSFILTIFTYSILLGIGIGFISLPSFTISMKWFPKSTGKVNAISLFSIAGSSLLMNTLLTYYINPNNYSPDKPYSDKYKDEKYFSQIDLLVRVPRSLLYLSIFYLVVNLTGFLFLFDYQSKETLISDEITTNVHINSIGVKYELPNEGLAVRDVFKFKSFYVIAIINSLSVSVPILPKLTYKLFGQTFINDDSYLSFIGSISGIFGAVGTLFWGFLIDKFSFKLVYSILNVSLISLSATIYFTKSIGLVKIVYGAWQCSFSFFYSGLTVIIPIVVVRIFGSKNYNAIYSLMNGLMMLSTFATGYVGTLYCEIGWLWTYLIGCLFLFTALMLCLIFLNVKQSNGRNV